MQLRFYNVGVWKLGINWQKTKRGIMRVWTMQEINAEMLTNADNLRIPRNDGHA